MALSEEEANGKMWCPFTRVSGAAYVDHQEWHTNRPSFAEIDQKHFDCCIGSACMAWRVSETPDEWNERLARWEDAANIADPHIVERGPAPTPYGYCGLAGGER